MIAHGKDIKVFCGNSNPRLATDICKLMGTKLGEAEVGTFSDGEIFVSLYETVRGSDVFVVQSTCDPVNKNLMELLIMGLAQLHQIRGRIGRSSRRAYAYLTFRRGKILQENAARRLSAIREYVEFGSGFKIAMRDLEIRGAGNLLGPEQSGYLMSVGYDMASSRRDSSSAA